MSTREPEIAVSGAGEHSWEQAVAALLADSDGQELARDCYFDGSALEAGQRYWASDEWQAVRLLLPAAVGKALDVGAGRGIASYALAREGWSVCALEPDRSALVGSGAIRDMAAAASYPIEVFEAFGEELPFKNAQFDLILARQSLHHARDLPSLLRELHRVLRPGGTLVTLRDHVISSRDDLARFQALHPLHRLYGGEYAYLLKEYVAAMRNAGFAIQQVIAPLDSPINYAPLTRVTLAAGIAAQLPNLPGVRTTASALLRVPAIMTLVLKLLRAVDRRPGRLYSFVAVRRA